MISRLSISNCLLRINESDSHDLNDLEEEYRNQALKELRSAVRQACKKNLNQYSEMVVHVSARRLHFYGKMGVLHPGDCQGRYRIRLAEVCWMQSDNNAPQNEIFVTFEQEEKFIFLLCVNGCHERKGPDRMRCFFCEAFCPAFFIRVSNNSSCKDRACSCISLKA